MTEHKLERIIHQESLPGGRLKGYARTVTYTIDTQGKLKRYEFVGKDHFLNREWEIKYNPFYQQLFGDLIPVQFSALVGVVCGSGEFRGSGKPDLELALIVGSLVYLALLPFRGQVYHNLLADKRAWDKYQSHLRLKLVE